MQMKCVYAPKSIVDFWLLQNDSGQSHCCFCLFAPKPRAKYPKLGRSYHLEPIHTPHSY